MRAKICIVLNPYSTYSETRLNPYATMPTMEKQGDEHGATSTYLKLGAAAQEERDFDSAESWYRKALDIEEKQDNGHGAVITYHQLGIIALEKQDYDLAESWCQKALDVFEKLGENYGATKTYHQLAMIALKKQDYDSAENWYRKALDIEEKHGEGLQRGENLPPDGHDRPEEGGLRLGGELVPKGPGCVRKTRRGQRRGEHLSPEGHVRPGKAGLRLWPDIQTFLSLGQNRPGKAGLRLGGRLVSKSPGYVRKTGQRPRGGEDSFPIRDSEEGLKRAPSSKYFSKKV